MFKLFKNLTKKDLMFAATIILLTAAQVWLELKIPDFTAKIATLAQDPNSDMGEILRNGGFMIACAAGSLVAAISAIFFVTRLSAAFTMRIRKKLFSKIEALDMSDVKRFSVSSLITRTTNDITQIQMLISMGANMLVRAPMTAIWAVVKILDKSWQWSAITALGVTLTISVMLILLFVVVPRFKLVQRLIDKINTVTRENLTGIRVVRAFNAERYQENKFDEVNNTLTKAQMFNQRAFAAVSPLIYLVFNGITLAIYYSGAHIINDAAPTERIILFGDMLVFFGYAMHIITSFLIFSMVFMMVPRAQVSAERINEVLDAEITIKDGEREDGDEELSGEIEFKHVSFKYPDAEEYLLDDISFTAHKGETVAFIGSTGSGKSTLINLIPRFYDATKGEILVDGVNTKEYSLRALRKKIGYVSQKAVIFDGSIRKNIAFGNHIKKGDKAAIKRAAKIAQADNFVSKMEHNYESHISQGGTNVSGGQKQRISIARAIARKPEFLIFDDSFSALDYKTDATLRGELKKHTADTTCLIVAQRVGTIMHADQIIVLDSGKCVGRGMHKELMKNCETYREIALSQLTEEELNV